MGQADSERALRTVHSAFLSHQVVSVGIIGLSFVGAKLLELIRKRCMMLLRQFQVRIRICALMSTDRMLLQKDENGSIVLDAAESWKKDLARSDTPASFASFLEHMSKQRRHWPHALVFDCSYSAQVGAHHPT